MKLFYAFVIVLMVLVSACTQQTPEVAPNPTPQPEVQPAEEAEVAEVVEEPVVEEATTTEVRMLAAGNFEPEELSINTGDAVTWMNDGERRGALILFKDGRAYMNSNPLDPGDKFEHEFTEAGSYDFWWNIAYGTVSGKLTVE